MRLVRDYGQKKEDMRPGARRVKRVLMLSWEFPPRIVGGIARHVDELSRALAEAGMEVDVLTAHHPGAPETEVIPARGGRVRVMRAGPLPIHPFDFVSEIHQLNFALLERLLQEGERDYDLIHAHDWLVAFAGRTLKHGRRLPLVATMHATEWGRNGGIHDPLQHHIHSIEWLLTYEAWRVICCSRGMAAEVQRFLTVPPDKVSVIPNGVDPRRVRCRDSRGKLERFRARWALPKDRIILFVGRLVREKGVQVLLQAMPEVLAAHPMAKLVVAGGGGQEELRAQAEALGLGDRVAFAGFVPEEDLPRLYQVAEVATFPSLYEPFGIVALEGMASGTPVVTSDAGGFREVVRNEETGLTTYVGDAHSVALAIDRILSDPALAARLREAGEREVKSRFGWERIAAKTAAAYAEVLRGTQGDAIGERMPMGGPGLRARYLGAGRS